MTRNQDKRQLTLKSVFYPSLKRKTDKAKFGLLGFIVIMAVVIAGCPMEINTNIGDPISKVKGITAGDPGTVEIKTEVKVPVYVDVPGQDVPFDFNRMRVVNQSSSDITEVKIENVSVIGQSGGFIPAGNSYQYRVDPTGTPPDTPVPYRIEVPSHSIDESVTMPPDQVLIINDNSHVIVDGDTLFPELPGIDNTKAYLIIVNESKYPINSIERSTTAPADWTAGDMVANGTVPAGGGVTMWEVPIGAIRQYKINRNVGASGDPAQILYPASAPLTFTNTPHVIRVFDDGAPYGNPAGGGTNPPLKMASIVVFNMSSQTLTSFQLNTAAPTVISLLPKTGGSKPEFYGTRVLVPDTYAVTVKSGSSEVTSTVGPVAENLVYSIFIGDDGSGGLSETKLDPATIDRAPPPAITTGIGITTGGTSNNNEITVTITTPPSSLPPDFAGYVVWIGNEDGSFPEKRISEDAVPLNRKVTFDHLANGTYAISVSTIDTSGNISAPYLTSVTVPWQSGAGGTDDPIWPDALSDQPGVTNWTKIRVINQSASAVGNVQYSRTIVGPLGYPFMINPVTIASGGQKVFSLKPGTYAFKFTGRTPTEWPVTKAWNLLKNVEYIIILNDSGDPVIIDPADPGMGGPEDPIIPSDPDYKPGGGGATFINVINNSTYPVTNVQFKTSSSGWLTFAGSPTAIAAAAQKLFAMKPGSYIFKFTGGYAWTETPLRAYDNGKFYIIVLSDDPPPLIIDPSDPWYGDGDPLFVKATGNDTSGNGTRIAPYATVTKALTKVTATKRTIMILGTVPVTSTITVNGSAANIGTTDPVTIQGEGGILNKTNDGTLLELTGNSSVILGADLTLNLDTEMTSLKWVVTVTGSRLDIKGADITGPSLSNSVPHYSEGLAITGGSTVYLRTGTISGFSGGGVWLSTTGTNYFFMEGGSITHNFLRGVSIQGTSEFTMTGGTIAYNEDTIGGGVHLEGSSKFIMYAPALITNNKATKGGGVHLGAGTTFTMWSGDISHNTVAQGGGGVSIAGAGANFFMYTGNISENGNASEQITNAGGGVSVENGTFTMLGGYIVGNLSKYGAGIWVDEYGSAQLGSDARISNNKPYTSGIVAGVEIYHPSAVAADHFTSLCILIDGYGSGNTTTQLVAVRAYSNISSTGTVWKQRVNMLAWTGTPSQYLLSTNVIPGNWD